MAIIRAKKALNDSTVKELGLETRYYCLEGFEPILGSQPMIEEVRTEWIGSKAPTESMTMDEAENFDPDIEFDKGCTGFARNPANGALCLYDYHVKGFLKEALKCTKATCGIGAPAGKVDNLVFVDGRLLPLVVGDDDGIRKGNQRIYERPLRAETMQCPRVALAASEIVDSWRIYIRVSLMPNAGTKASKPVTWEAIENALRYGEYKGLGQWRSGGFGRFKTYAIEDADSIAEVCARFLDNPLYMHRPTDIV